MPALRPELAAAYERTIFRAFEAGGALDFHVGVDCRALRALMRAHAAETAAFITAYNPSSELRPDADNAAASEALRTAIAADGWAFLPGEGVDPTGHWRSEPSFLVFGIPRPNAVALAARFGQAAIVFICTGHAPELVFIEEN